MLIRNENELNLLEGLDMKILSPTYCNRCIFQQVDKKIQELVLNKLKRYLPQDIKLQFCQRVVAVVRFPYKCRKIRSNIIPKQSNKRRSSLRKVVKKLQNN